LAAFGLAFGSVIWGQRNLQILADFMPSFRNLDPHEIKANSKHWLFSGFHLLFDKIFARLLAGAVNFSREKNFLNPFVADFKASYLRGKICLDQKT
jgi:hypothetical protein